MDLSGILSSQSSGCRSSEWDIYNTKGRFERQVSGISCWKTTEGNKQRFLDFLRRIEVEGVGIVQRVKYVESFKALVSVMGYKEIEDVTEKDIEQFLYSMQNYSPATRHLRWVCVKKFMRYQGKEDVFRNIKPKFPHLNHKLPEELLTPLEVEAMVNSVGTVLEKCLLKTLWESGMRSGEIMTLRLKHVSFDERGAVIICNGKTGQRRIRLVETTELLRQLVIEHPSGDTEDRLWIKPDGKAAGHSYLNVLCKKAARRANVRKRIYNHLFRHSRASFLARFLTESELRIFFGWQGSSRMVETYIHMTDKQVGDKIIELHKSEEKKEATTSTEIIEFFACMMKRWKEEKK